MPPYDEKTPLWTVICPGPSLNQPGLILRHTPGQVIAVNSAILAPFPISFWAIGDLCLFANLMEADPCAEIIPELITLWVTARWEKDVQEQYSDLHTKFCRFERETYPYMNWDDLARSMPFGRDLDWRSFTLLTALALAVKKGAKRILVYGADFSGDQYFADGVKNERTNLSEDRFRCEEELFEAIRARAILHDVVISREGVNNTKEERR